MTASPSPLSGYSDVDAAPAPEEYVRRLDEVGASAFWASLKQRTYASLELTPGATVLDIGCGTGDDVRAMAALVGPHGRATGVDASATMIAEARRRTNGSGVVAEYVLADAQALDFPDATFDACRAERVLQHLADPCAALAEMVRVARSGARIVAIEPDHGAMAVVGADPALTRHIVASRLEHLRHGRIGRELSGLFRAAGLTNVGLTLLMLSSLDAVQDAPVLAKHARRAEAAGRITAAERAAWLSQLHAAGMQGRYRQSLPVFVVHARKA